MVAEEGGWRKKGRGRGWKEGKGYRKRGNRGGRVEDEGGLRRNG